jgi:hypothetical protein
LPGLFQPEYSGRNEKITAENIPTTMKKIQESTPVCSSQKGKQASVEKTALHFHSQHS